MARRPEYRRLGKRGRICDWPKSAQSPEEVAEMVRYEGNQKHESYHRRSAGREGRWEIAQCDRYTPEDWPKLEDVLRMAIKAQCIQQFRGGFPSRAWAYINDCLHEARLTEQEQGLYHGFPIDDPTGYPEPADLLEERAPHVNIP